MFRIVGNIWVSWLTDFITNTYSFNSKSSILVHVVFNLFVKWAVFIFIFWAFVILWVGRNIVSHDLDVSKSVSKIGESVECFNNLSFHVSTPPVSIIGTLASDSGFNFHSWVNISNSILEVIDDTSEFVNNLTIIIWTISSSISIRIPDFFIIDIDGF
jgi:hypothetical protein